MHELFKYPTWVDIPVGLILGYFTMAAITAITLAVMMFNKDFREEVYRPFWRNGFEVTFLYTVLAVLLWPATLYLVYCALRGKTPMRCEPGADTVRDATIRAVVDAHQGPNPAFVVVEPAVIMPRRTRR